VAARLVTDRQYRRDPTTGGIMTLVLPRLTDMVRADEYTLSPEQELRLLDDRPRRSRWWISPEQTPPPGPSVDGDALTEPWLDPWLQLNDPTEDAMTGVCILNEADAAQGILIFVHPTPEAEAEWQRAWHSTLWAPLSLGCETNIRVPYPQVDYRAVFRCVLPLRRITGGSVRWAFQRPHPDASGWDVVTGGWVPPSARRQPTPPPEIEP
jgi:hypothetical protein